MAEWTGKTSVKMKPMAPREWLSVRSRASPEQFYVSPLPGFCFFGRRGCCSGVPHQTSYSYSLYAISNLTPTIDHQLHYPSWTITCQCPSCMAQELSCGSCCRADPCDEAAPRVPVCIERWVTHRFLAWRAFAQSKGAWIRDGVYFK